MRTLLLILITGWFLPVCLFLWSNTRNKDQGTRNKGHGWPLYFVSELLSFLVCFDHRGWDSLWFRSMADNGHRLTQPQHNTSKYESICQVEVYRLLYNDPNKETRPISTLGQERPVTYPAYIHIHIYHGSTVAYLLKCIANKHSMLNSAVIIYELRNTWRATVCVNKS